MENGLDKIREWIKTQLPRRAGHIFGCEQTAVELARRWGEDEEKARTAALFHDLTKYYSAAEQLNSAEKYGIMEKEDFLIFPPVVHAFTAAALAEYEYGLDEDVVNAIRWHTTGRA